MFACAKRILAVIALAFWHPMVHAIPTRSFDLERIHGEYRNGDFDKVIQDLTRFLKSGRKCLRSDSIFLEKHLAVVYAANPATRELGRYHMHQLLDISSSADLIDMFVGEEVDYVFEKVRKEHFLTAVVPNPQRPQPKTALVLPAPIQVKTETLPVAAPTPSVAEVPLVSGKESDGTWSDTAVLIGAGTALALVAFTLYYSASPKETPSKTYVIPAAATP